MLFENSRFNLQLKEFQQLQAVYDAKSEEIGPGIYRFKAELGSTFWKEQSCHRLVLNNIHLLLKTDLA